MNVVYQSLGLLLLVTGALSATIGYLGNTCTIGVDTCSVNGAVCDKSSSTCQCQFGYVRSGDICSRSQYGLCGVGMCKSPGMMTCDTTTSTCKCDTTKGYTVSGTSCACAANYVMDNGECKKVNGQTCTATSECHSSLVCTGGLCKCDTAKHFTAGTAGTFSCACDAAYPVSNGVCCASGTTGSNGICCAANTAESNGACKKAIGESCTPALGDCHPNLVCTGTSGAETCKCDTNKHFTAPGATGTTTCACDASYTIANGICCLTASEIESNGVCKLIATKTCTAGSAECHPNLICEGTTPTCKCDTTKHYAATAATPTTCGCDTGYTGSNGLCCAIGTESESNGACKKVNGQSCTATAECHPNLICTGTAGSLTCQCDTTKNQTAGTTGTTSCGCVTGFTKNYLGTCAINVGGTCTRDEGTYIPCVDDAVCDLLTDTCQCDSAAGYQTSGTGCGCKSGYTLTTSGYCVADLNGFCIPSTQSGVCVSGATCFAGNSTHVPQCLCDSNQYDYKGSCSGAGGVVASLASLLMALFMTSRLM